MRRRKSTTSALNANEILKSLRQTPEQFRHAHPHFDSPVVKDLNEKLGIHMILPLEKLRGGEKVD